MSPYERVPRRRYLAGVGAASVGLTAGCLDVLDGGDSAENTVLDPPEQYELLREARDNDDLVYPIHGDPLPDVSAPCTIRDEPVATTDFEDKCHTMYTFIFSRCHAACPGLVSGLRHVQADAIDEGVADEVALKTVTFDPEYDTPDVLYEYGAQMGVDYDVGNWYFIRPETEDAAHEYVEEAFGCYFARNPEYEGGDHADDEHGHEDDGHGDEDEHGHGDENDHSNDDHEQDDMRDMEMAFMHESMIVLANADGYVERTYAGEVPTPDVLIDDARTLVDRW
ncbi:SCO family protein [Halovivax gelatinilyticus]|uniref:SCO family protein n=1 Tax=Halovivax gelatinilyticus TaxID=2961597 RepID=UPI0020CA5303|nr:SCO family protein [Halovivax gelatinilyticus]